MQWENILNKIMNFLDTYDPKRQFEFDSEREKIFSQLRDEFLETFIFEILGEERIREAYFFVEKFREVCDKVKSLYGLTDIILSRELRRFVKNPMHHIKHVLRFYVFDLFRKHITKEEFYERASAAVRTAKRTNERACYERWVFLTLLKQIKEKDNARIIYPETGALMLTRAGKQKLAIIPPDVIVQLSDLSYLSFFLEAPRPITWGDTIELKFVWKLYKLARPDIMIFFSKVFNILDLNREPPIKRPNVIIEIKFLENWWKRKRLLHVFSEGMTIERWRSLWLRGLISGLGKLLGYKSKSEDTKPEKGVYASDLQILEIYKEIFKPDILVCVSMVPVPHKVKEDLEDKEILLIDDVGFDETKLEEITDYLLKSAKSSQHSPLAILSSYMHSLGVSLSEDELISLAIKFCISHKEEFLAFLKKNLAMKKVLARK